mgnify:CR=1 FL=1
MIDRKSLRDRGFDLLGALIVIALLFAAYDRYRQWTQAVQPVSDWIEVTRLEVADADVGEDPDVLFERVVHRDLTGDWYAEVHEVTGRQSCAGRGNASYTVDEPDQLRFPLSDFIGSNRCAQQPGTYILNVVFKMRDDSGLLKTLRAQSNPFYIREAGVVILESPPP